MDKDVYKMMKQSKVNRKQKLFNVAIAIILLGCVSRIERLNDKINILKLKNDNGASENMKGE